MSCTNEILNCPNCGAPVTGEKCEYCGTVFYDFSTIDFEKPNYIKMRINGKLIIFKAVLTYVNITNQAEPELFYSDNALIRTAYVPDVTVSAEFHVIPDDDVLYKIRLGDKAYENPD